MNTNKILAKVMLALAIVWALFRGYRMPNQWSVNYYQLSMMDGFFRRSLLGTLLGPLGCLRFNYNVIAAIQFGVLVALVTLMVVHALRSGMIFYAAIYFFACGGFLFHEVGYVDQAIYLGMFAGLYFCEKGWYIAVAIVAALLLMVSEIAIFSVIPILAIAPLIIRNEQGNWAASLKIVTPAAIIFLVQSTWLQSYPVDVLGSYLDKIHGCGYDLIRRDYLDAMSTSYKNRYALYFSIPQITFAALPLVVLCVTICRSVGRHCSWSENFRLAVIITGICPLALGLFGWDTNRWIFLTFTNIFGILLMAYKYQNIQGARDLNLEVPQAIMLLLAFTLHFPYFDGLSERQLDTQGFSDFTQNLQRSFREQPQR